jgi:NADPH-dependent 2,4-dienoyl-CoA reductase/sulfur reductase-like enzyme
MSTIDAGGVSGIGTDMRDEQQAVVVVGAGAAGLSVVTGLRRRGHSGQITVIGDERSRPYDRPPLSKEILAGSWTPDRVQLRSDSQLLQLGAEWHLGTPAADLDVARQEVMTADGAVFGYDALVVATGVRPRRLSGAWTPDPRIHELRTLDDALALRTRVSSGARIVVVGAGFLGLEVAATVRAAGAAVEVVEPQSAPLGSRLGATFARRLLELHRERGVRVRTGVEVDLLDLDRTDAVRVGLSDGSELMADAVLIAVGCEPNVEWMADSGIDVSDGVLCDATCSVTEGVWAAGDGARWWHRHLRRHMRLEHRMNANEQGEAVAANILGAGAAFAPIPYFWTTQWGAKVQAWGVIDPTLTERMVWEDRMRGALVHAFVEPSTDAVIGAVGWNAPRELMLWRTEIAEHWNAGVTS